VIAFWPEGLQVNLDAPQTRDLLAATYLQQLQALAAEIPIAMDAIAAHALPTLQESIARQESLCASLGTMAAAFGDGPQTGAESPAALADAAVDAKIRAARRAVVELNTQYAALLKHSGRSIALLISLCRSHTGNFQEALGPRLKHQTWSCEV
jgi:hypothetical protein